MNTQETQSDNTRDNAPFAGHTPGPLFVSPAAYLNNPESYRVMQDIGAGTRQVAICRTRADAELYAAAPALAASHCALVAALENLRAILEMSDVRHMICDGGAGCLGEASWYHQEINAARKALSDARKLTAGMEGGAEG